MFNEADILIGEQELLGRHNSAKLYESVIRTCETLLILSNIISSKVSKNTGTTLVSKNLQSKIYY